MTKHCAGHEEHFVQNSIKRMLKARYAICFMVLLVGCAHSGSSVLEDNTKSQTSSHDLDSFENIFLSLPPEAVGGMNLIDRRKLINLSKENSNEPRFDSMHGYVNYYSDGYEGIESRIGFYLKRLRLENGCYAIFSHSLWPLGHSNNKTPNTCIYIMQEGKWIDVSASFLTNSLRNDYYIEAARNSNIFTLAMYEKYMDKHGREWRLVSADKMVAEFKANQFHFGKTP